MFVVVVTLLFNSCLPPWSFIWSSCPGGGVVGCAKSFWGQSVFRQLSNSTPENVLKNLKFSIFWLAERWRFFRVCLLWQQVTPQECSPFGQLEALRISLWWVHWIRQQVSPQNGSPTLAILKIWSLTILPVVSVYVISPIMVCCVQELSNKTILSPNTALSFPLLPVHQHTYTGGYLGQQDTHTGG